MSDILSQLKRRTASELEKRVNAALPSGIQLRLNPSEGEEEKEEDEGEEDEDEEGEEGEDEEGEDEEGEDEEGEDEDDEDELDAQPISFEDASAEDNLACACAAYRIVGCDGYIVATHAQGPAHFGTMESLAEYAEGKDLDPQGWEVYDNAEDILDMPYDHDTLKKVIRMCEDRESSYEDAEDFYKKFHWGNPSNVQVVKNIPGVHGTLVHLGVARRIEYGSNKNSEWAEYYHLFGENTKEYPSMYAIMNEDGTEPTALLIHGGNMRIEPRGVVE